MKKLFVLIAAIVTLPLFAQENLARLLRQPDIQGNRIVFVYGGDLWLADRTGGDARRLTADDGLELFPKFSPDGRWIAYTAEYGGNKQVYVISVDGGQPRQLTFYNDIGQLPPRGGVDNRVVDWSPDGKNILFNPHRLPYGDRMSSLWVVPFAGGMEAPLGIPEGSAGSFSPDGTKVVYTPIEREFRTWKNYRGGRAQDVWTWDIAAKKAERLTDHVATDNQPVWIANAIYFTSDREGGRLNLWRYDLATKALAKMTDHKDFDVLWPSGDATQVVYENGGYIWRFDSATGKSERVPVRVSGDFRNTVPYFRNVKSNVESFNISPSGARALFVARGDVFTAPAKNGEIRNLTQTPGVRERDAVWSPDGKWIAYLSDKNGDTYEVYVRPADGGGAERQVTTGSKGWRFALRWSPDSKYLAFSDKDQKLRFVEVSTGKLTDIDRDEYTELTHYRWSPDSRWIAYTKQNEARFSSIYVYSIPDAKSYRLTSGLTDDTEPVFDPKGRYLYFLSNRDFNLTFSAFEFSYVYTEPTRVYIALLANDGPAILLPQSDEEKGTAPAAAPASEEKPKSEAKTEPKSVNVKIDVAGFESRVRAIPGSSGNYGALSAVAAGPVYMTGPQGRTALKMYNLEDRKEETILESIEGYEIAANGEKLIFTTGADYGVAAVRAGQKSNEGQIALDRLEMRIEPKAEWAQQYRDAWRIVRDWFYDPNMHGVDWNALGQRYGELVPHVAHRADFDYILGELIGELHAGHAYHESSADWRVKRTEHGLLGAEIVSDASGYYAIAKIFPGENWLEKFRSPLTEPGVKVKEGEYILAVDGVSTKGVDNFYRLMENKANRIVTLLVNSRPDTAGAREEKVKPITKETNVRYLDWVRSRREYVEKASGGRIGYVHLPNTAGEGNQELFKFFYPSAHKDALIIDDRYNGGGFIPDRMIELLDRPLLNLWARRGVQPNATPAYGHSGPKVMLTNGYSSSGGDALPYYFRKRGLGTIIGTRTWGGLIGLSGNPALMDGGSVLVPTFRFLDTEGNWDVEGIGVSPDIEVIDRPDEVAAGKDPSLEAAVKLLMDQLAKNPPKKIAVPPVTVNRN